MKKSELLPFIDQELLDSLFGFCYQRTTSSHAAEELCSDIVYELVRTANSEGEIEEDAVHAFIWRIARHVYADYSERRSRETARAATGDPETLFALLTDEEDSEAREAAEHDRAALRQIYHRIANLSNAYRTVMIAYYLDNTPIREIAAKLGAKENTIRQRLFSARESLRKEVTNMETTQKPVNLRHLELILWGNGNPVTGDPRTLIERQLSRHILWLCRNKEMSAREIAEELNVPMLYIEEELALQAKGVGETHYATLRKLPNGRYISNIPLLSREEFLEGRAIYEGHHPALCDKIQAFLRDPKIAKEHFNFPYLNHAPTLDLIWWQHLPVLAYKLGDMVDEMLKDKYFADVTPDERPFHLFGYEATDIPVSFCGWDGVSAKNICGYREVYLENLYTPHLAHHFHCGHDVGNDAKLQLAIRAIDGLPVSELTEEEREQAARAIECGYLMREDDTLYTKILVMKQEDRERIYLIDHDFREQVRPIAEEVTEKTAAWIRSVLPAHLLPYYQKVAHLASTSIVEIIFDDMVRRGLLELPERGIGAEGCWMSVEK